jgi:hypothetical protein
MTMDTSFPLSSAPEADDLPRTLRRERDRQRAAASASANPLGSAIRATDDPATVADFSAADLTPAAVKRIEVPFFHLMVFFLKAVLAAIPGLILLTAILGFGGHLLQLYFPELIQTKIIICTPDNPKGC